MNFAVSQRRARGAGGMTHTYRRDLRPRAATSAEVRCLPFLRAERMQ